MTTRAQVSMRHQLWMWLTGLVGSRYDGLHHFAVVEPGILMRCGQPRVSELEQIRLQHGLRTVVCARGGTRHPLRGRWFRREIAYCRETGIHMEHMPFSDRKTPPSEVFERFVEILRGPENRPVLVHCEQGFHRTGILCAAFRIAIQNWPVEQAFEEMAQMGFDLGADRRRNLADALRQWATNRSPLLAP